MAAPGGVLLEVAFEPVVVVVVRAVAVAVAAAEGRGAPAGTAE